MSNKLWILRLGKSPLQWRKPKTKGAVPNGRIQHTMNYVKNLNFIIVYGGKTRRTTINHILILTLQNLNWINIDC